MWAVYLCERDDKGRPKLEYVEDDDPPRELTDYDVFHLSRKLWGLRDDQIQQLWTEKQTGGES